MAKDADDRVRMRVLVRDLTLDAVLGIHAHEKTAAQPIRVNLWLDVRLGPINDRYENVVCYHEAAKRIEAIIAAGHVNLVETWAEEIAHSMLADPRVDGVRVRIEKLAAVPRTASVGVEIERRR
jgi:dihydroneopterin aldolase